LTAAVRGRRLETSTPKGVRLRTLGVGATAKVGSARTRNTNREFHGGDLLGVEERLDHVESLGANAIWLTPFFRPRAITATTRPHTTTSTPLLGGTRRSSRWYALRV